MTTSEIINLILCILSFVLAAISVITVVITLKQNNKMLEANVRPYVVVYLVLRVEITGVRTPGCVSPEMMNTVPMTLTAGAVAIPIPFCPATVQAPVVGLKQYTVVFCPGWSAGALPARLAR